MNDYQRLNKYGWELIYTTSRHDYFKKKKWIAMVPVTTRFEITFVRNGSRYSPSGITREERQKNMEKLRNEK